MSKIIKLYLKELVSFPVEVQLHFLTRLFRISGNKEYLIPVKKILANDIEDKLYLAEQLNSFDPQLVKTNDFIRSTIRRNPIENARIQRREAYYQKFPLLKYYFNVLQSTQTFFDNKLDKGRYRKRIQSIALELKGHDWSWFLSPHHLLINPVSYVNCTYYLKNLNITDEVNYLETIIKQNFSPELVFDKIKLFDQLYTYTHIIIGESRFYQQFLSLDQVTQYDWIFDFFEKNFLIIFQKINLDLILEVLLCYYLANKTLPSAIQETADNYLSNFYDQSHTYLLVDEKATLCDMEHANILLIMLQDKPEKLFSVNEPLF